MGSGTDGTRGSGAGRPGARTERPGVGRAAPPGPLSLCCPASPGRPPVVLGRRGPAQPRERGLGARRGQCGTIHRCLSVVPEPGRLGWEEEGASVRAAAAAANATSWPSPVVSREGGNGGTLPKKGCRSLSHVGGPGVRETTGSLVYRLAGGHVSAGLCPCDRRGRGGKIQVASLPCGLPWAGERRATQLGCGHRAGGGPTPRGTIPGEGAGGPLGAAALPAREDTGGGWPLGAGPRVAGWAAAGAKASGPLPGGWARLGPQEITIITK